MVPICIVFHSHYARYFGQLFKFSHIVFVNVFTSVLFLVYYLSANRYVSYHVHECKYDILFRNKGYRRLKHVKFITVPISIFVSIS